MFEMEFKVPQSSMLKRVLSAMMIEAGSARLEGDKHTLSTSFSS
jgi:hypothetical protein